MLSMCFKLEGLQVAIRQFTVSCRLRVAVHREEPLMVSEHFDIYENTCVQENLRE